MKTTKTNGLLAVMAVMILALAPAAARATDIKFNIQIPTIPYPPLISDVTNTQVPSGSGNFTVTATIAGQKQQLPVCDKPNRNDCIFSDWHFIDEPGVTPNPPDIKAAKVFYYINDDALHPQSVDMAVDGLPSLNKWKATVPVSEVSAGDSVTYYIVAIDGRGNVTSQVPDTGAVNQTCPSSPTGWNPEFSTPATNNCSYMTSVSRCQINYAIPPDPAPSCPATYTMGDPAGDVCGEPDADGKQVVITDNRMDIKGISAAADGTNFCANYGLGGAPPDSSDPSPIEGYLLIIFNPDIEDDNPGDLWIKNAYAITYAPEVVGTDSTLVRVLWDANCLTNPSTQNVLDCKLITISGSDPKLQVGYNNGLKFIVRKSGTGDTDPVPYSLIGQTSKMTYLIGVTGEINLSGGTAFWFSDLTAGMGFYQKNQVAIASGAQPTVWPPQPPRIDSADCSADGTGTNGHACPKSSVQPQQSKCRIAYTYIQAPPDAYVIPATEYHIYKSSFSSSVPYATVSSTGTVWIDQNMGPLDGSTATYRWTGYNKDYPDANKRETPIAQAASTYCMSEDWVPPSVPAITRSETPQGASKSCRIDWTASATDTTLSYFSISRDGSPLTSLSHINYQPGAASYSATDTAGLELKQTYSYTVTAIDASGNTAESAAGACAVQDLESPSMISTLTPSNLSGKLGVHLDWQASPPAEETVGYNAWFCKRNNSTVDCIKKADFTKMNSSPISATSFESDSSTFFPSSGDYSFYIEACDNCAAFGTCPGNPPVQNCSSFPPGGANDKTHVITIPIDSVCETKKPAFPSNLTTDAPAEGFECDLSWTKNCMNSDGSAFADCNDIEPTELSSYKVMQGPQGSVPTPSQAPPEKTVTLNEPMNFADTNLTNGAQYCYAVYGADACANVSENGAGGNKTEVCCTPRDTVAPTVPAIQQVESTDSTCIPEWTVATDRDPALSYKVYKCNGDLAACNSASNFTLDTADCAASPNLACTDYSVTKGQAVTYCVTAADSSLNESTKLPSNRANCGVCIPGQVLPATGTVAVPTSDNLGAQVSWKLSASDGHTMGGYNIYRCADSACATKTKAKTCNDLSAASDAVKNISAAAPVTLTPEPSGSWYYGVMFQKDCSDSQTESLMVGSSIAGPVPIGEPCEPSKTIKVSSCDNFDTKTGCSPVMAMDTSAGYPADHGGFPKTPYSPIKIELLKEDGTSVGDAITESSGNFEIKLCNKDGHVSLTDKYMAIIVVKDDMKAGVPCSGTETGVPARYTCAVIAKSGFTLMMGGPPIKIVPPALPKSGQGRSEIANPNCDNSIDGDDFLILRQNYGKAVGPGADDAKSFSDFNGDGAVDSDDFLILRNNYGKNIDAAPSYVDGLCKQ